MPVAKTKAKREKARTPKKRVDRNSPPANVTVQQAATELGVSRHTVYGWIDRRVIGYQDFLPADPNSTQKLYKIPWSEVLRIEKETYRPPLKSK